MDGATAGFYYMVYQPNPGKERVKVWLDGDTAYKFFKYEELLTLVPYNMQSDMKKSLMEYSLFLWDVQGDFIKRLSFKGEKIPIGEWISKKKTEGQVVEEAQDPTSLYWKTHPLEDGIIIEK